MMKNFLSAVILAFIPMTASANLYFDEDGGKCDDESSAYTELGPEGMAYSNNGSRYIGSGGAIIDIFQTKTGLYQFEIDAGGGMIIWWTVDPVKGELESARVNDIDSTEGNLGYMTFKACKP